MTDNLNIVENILYLADSYKVTHHLQYPPGTTNVYSYFESRGGKFKTICFFGLQYIIKRWLVGCVVNKEMISDAKAFYESHFGTSNLFNEEGWNYIVDKHAGKLPLRIKAVPEGSVIPVKNVLFTVENTDPNVPWLTNWVETLLVQVWYPMTVCTNSRAQKEIIAEFLHVTAGKLDGLAFKLHDFGYRGVSSVESAGIGAAGHLVNFSGSDTVAGLQLCRKYYGCPMAGFSVPAAEHSTITSWGKSREAEAYKNMLDKFPSNSVSVVSDSYDIYAAVSGIWGEQLRDQVMERGMNGCVVIRPDSGDPVQVILKVLQLLSVKFPTTVNSRGYKILPNYLRIIQGDGISYESIRVILSAVKTAGWSAENIIFGTGGALLQMNVCKTPLTDDGKRSKRGRLILEKTTHGEYRTLEEGKGDPVMDVLQTVFENGRLLIDQTLDEIRERAKIDIVRNHENGQSLTNGREACSVFPGDVVTVPSLKVVINAPFHVTRTYDVKVTNTRDYPIAWSAKVISSRSFGISPSYGILDANEEVLVVVTVDPFVFREEDSTNDRIEMLWIDVPKEEPKVLRAEWFENSQCLRRKVLRVIYNI